MTDIGPHLLGRIPSPPDERDFVARNFLGLGEDKAGTTDPVQLVTQAVAELKLTTISYPKWAATKYTDVTQTHWWKALNYLSQVAPSPSPSPTPTGDKVWQDKDQLDQGNYGTCVGNGWAQWGNTDPVNDNYTEKDARAIYYEATVFDGSPDNPDAPGGGQQGATVRSGAKAMQQRTRLSTYAQAATEDDIKAWIAQKGPVVVGTDWMNDMFNPDANGYVKPTGGVAGGHCYLLVGDLESEGAFFFQNSWGSGWGQNGYFKMKYADFQTLLSKGGEAWVAVELSL